MRAVTGDEIIELIGQGIGFIAIALAIMSFQAKTRAGILILQGAANLVWSVHFLMLGTVVGAATTFIAGVRNLLYAAKGRWRWVGHPAVPLVFSAIGITVGILTYENLFSILIISANVVSALSYSLNREKLIRLFSLYVSGAWLIFNSFAVLSIAGIGSESFNIISILVSLFRYRKKRNSPISDSENLNTPTVVKADSKE